MAAWGRATPDFGFMFLAYTGVFSVSHLVFTVFLSISSAFLGVSRRFQIGRLFIIILAQSIQTVAAIAVQFSRAFFAVFPAFFSVFLCVSKLGRLFIRISAQSKQTVAETPRCHYCSVFTSLVCSSGAELHHLFHTCVYI